MALISKATSKSRSQARAPSVDQLSFDWLKPGEYADSPSASATPPSSATAQVPARASSGSSISSIPSVASTSVPMVRLQLRVQLKAEAKPQTRGFQEGLRRLGSRLQITKGKKLGLNHR